MDRKQIEKWAREADEWADKEMHRFYGASAGTWPVDEWNAERNRERDERFVLLVRKAALEEAAMEAESVGKFAAYQAGTFFQDYIAQRIRTLIDKEPS